MRPSQIKILFLCTGNSARSILGEYLLRHLGGGRFHTVSAGAAPTGRVHPLALQVLSEDYGLDATDARSESLTDHDGAELDLVITVCDHARDTCPIFPGAAPGVHWGSPDPAAATGDEALDLFRRVAREIEHRVRLLVELPWDELGPDERLARLRAIGEESPAEAA